MAQRISNTMLRLRSNPPQPIPLSHPSSTISYASRITTRLYASTSSSTDQKSNNLQGIGEVGKGDKNARPVILEHAAPADPKDPDVRKHNEEFEKRPDRAVNDDKSPGMGGSKGKETGKKP